MAKHFTYATFDELMTIDGIGDTEANKIIKYRVEKPINSWYTFKELAPSVLFHEVARLHQKGVWKSHMVEFKLEMDFASKSANATSNKCDNIKTQVEALGEKCRKGREELSLRIEGHRKEFHDNFKSLDRKFLDRLDELAEKIHEHQEKMDEALKKLYNHLDCKFDSIFKMLDTSPDVTMDCQSKELGLHSSTPTAQPPPHRPPDASETDKDTSCPLPTLEALAAQGRVTQPLEDSTPLEISVSMPPEDSPTSCSWSMTAGQSHGGCSRSLSSLDKSGSTIEFPNEPRKATYIPPHLKSTYGSPGSRHICPEPFGGKFCSVDTWLQKFNVIARDCGWSHEEKLRLLTASLAGRGIDTTQLFPEEVRNNFPSLCRALRRKYRTPLQDRRMKISSPYSCHGCGGKGHYVRHCSTRKNHSTSSVRCYECGGYGHISIYCGNHIHHQVNGPPWHSRSNSPDWRATMRPLNPWTETTRDL